MPPKARIKFQKVMLPEVENLVEIHRMLRGTCLGKRKLSHITRSGVLMLCASWELYVEELAIEMAGYLSECAKSPGCLPEPVPRTIANIIVNAIKSQKNHELMPLTLAGDGWR